MSNNQTTKSQYDDPKFKQWLTDNHWHPYGPTLPNNPLRNAIPETYVWQGPGRARHESAENLYAQFLESEKKQTPAKKTSKKK